ncbi:MAG: RNA polymerase sigma factor [Bacillota bacterium]
MTVQPVFADESKKMIPFEALYDDYFDRVNRYLRYRVPSMWDADDLTATVFTKAFEKYHLFRGEAPVAVWLFRITHNVFVDYIRRRDRYVPAGSEIAAGSTDQSQPEDELLRAEELAGLRKMLDMLDPGQRDVISMRYVGELKFGQIARVLNKTEAAVRMIHYRALKALRSRLREER